MKLINIIRAARLDGQAIKCFSLGMHDRVIELLEKAIEIDNEESRIEIRNYYLGLSYKKLGVFLKASKALAIAYYALIERVKEDESYLEKLKTLSKEYVDLLVAKGENVLANNIIEQTNKILFDRGYDLDLSKKVRREFRDDQ